MRAELPVVTNTRPQRHYGPLRLLLAACAAAATGCTSVKPADSPAAPAVIVVTPPPAPPAPAAAAQVAPEPPQTAAAVLALDYADRLRAMTVPNLAQEIARLNEPNAVPGRQLQLAMALALTRVPSDLQRAQGLLQRVLDNATGEARALHPLARLLAAQYAEQRRADEATERQAQLLRDAQRRIDQLNDRLEAVRAIERSLSTRPAGGASAPRSPSP